MGRLLSLFRSTLGKKVIVAVTGIILLGFLIGHVGGNLKVFLPDSNGVPDIDHYAEGLRELGEPLLPHDGALWAARTVLLIALVLHVICVIQLSLTNRAARPVGYQNSTLASATAPARWMMYTGIYLLVFIVFHILHFTVGVVEPAKFEHGSVFQNLSASFSNVFWVAVYVISMAVLAMHLYHGVWSLFQTLGWDNPDRNRGLRKFAVVLAVLLFIGFVAVPTSFMVGILKSADDRQQSGIGTVDVFNIDVTGRSASTPRADNSWTIIELAIDKTGTDNEA